MAETTRKLGYLIKRAQNSFRIRMDHALGEIGLTASQYAVLASLEEEPGLSNADLARRSFVTPQTMIRIVTVLEERSLISRRTRSDNARVRAATVTGEGRRVLRSAHLVVGQIESEMTEGLSDAELGRLAKSLKKLAQRLES